MSSIGLLSRGDELIECQVTDETLKRYFQLMGKAFPGQVVFSSRFNLTLREDGHWISRKPFNANGEPIQVGEGGLPVGLTVSEEITEQVRYLRKKITEKEALEVQVHELQKTIQEKTQMALRALEDQRVQTILTLLRDKPLKQIQFESTDPLCAFLQSAFIPAELFPAYMFFPGVRDMFRAEFDQEAFLVEAEWVLGEALNQLISEQRGESELVYAAELSAQIAGFYNAYMRPFHLNEREDFWQFLMDQRPDRSREILLLKGQLKPPSPTF